MPFLQAKDIAHYLLREKVDKAGEGSSWFTSVFLVMNTALGAGLLNFSLAYHQAGGIVISVAIQSMFIVFVVVAAMILGYSSDVKQSATLQDTVHVLCGTKARNACAMSILVYSSGTCITLLVLIGDLWEQVFLFVDKPMYCYNRPMYMDRTFTIVVTSCVFVLPMIFPKRIDFLKYVSMVGVVGILYVVGLVTIKYFLPHPSPGPVKTHPDSWTEVFVIVPVICYGYQCHVAIIPIYSCMEKRNLRELSKTVSLAMALCVLIYTASAALGYLMFGANVNSDILLSFEPGIPTLIAVTLTAVKIYAGYPILSFCGREAVDSLWIAFWNMTDEEVLKQERSRRLSVSAVLFLMTLGFAIFIPNIGVVIQVLGAFDVVFIFIFPGMCLLAIMLEKMEQSWKVKFMLYFACVFIVLGAFIIGLTLCQALMADIKNHGVKGDNSRFTC